MNVLADTFVPISATIGDLLAGKLQAAHVRHTAFTQSHADVSPSNWGETFARWCIEDETGYELTRALQLAERLVESESEGVTRRRLVALFRLDPAERDLFDTALALGACPSLALDLARFGGLGEHAITALYGHPNRPIMRPTSPLVVWSLIERDGLGLRADPDIAALVSGRPGLDRCLAECAQIVEPLAVTPPSWPVEATVQRAVRLIEMGRATRVAIAALPGSGRQLFAAAVAKIMSGRVISIKPDRAVREDDVYMRAQRMALLTGHALFWDGPMPNHAGALASAPLQFVAALPNQPLPPCSGLADLWVELPVLAREDKLALWRAVGGDGSGVTLEDCGQALGGARVADLLALAALAPEDESAARDALARRVRTRIAGSGNLLDQPYRREDLVLAPGTTAQFATVMTELKARERLFEVPDLARRYGGLGQSILLHGPPGCGKTMAATVLARELGAELVRVDCASIISKYVGETIRQLRELFDRIEGSGVIVLFDEADTLFAKRTELKDAHDRHANADTNYLLQLIEAFDGVAILATNRKENLDPAFLRRLRYVVEFGSLGADARATLWKLHLEALAVPADRAAGWATRLGLADLTPAQIKGAALTGHFVRDTRRENEASLQDFVTGIERELAKDGSAIDAALRARISDA
jgi:hypothetical protein